MDTAGTLRRLEKAVTIEEGDTCFVMMPFAEPIGSYYKTVYEPAIVKAGLRSIRADDDMFKTGKIVDQTSFGIHGADDVPFDVQHIRVIYYDVYDAFWGEKLIAKIAETSCRRCRTLATLS